ncbi:CCCH zinc finger DNA binding protein [Apiospora kogelbergensis]|uniref:CCCH zinc finger DNA binding protein n=1 Tax=Apiospora kogelbergensis TaxID=1337665 RepID=UPI003130FA11
MESIMDFIPRYREYQTQKDRTECLIKDLMIHCEHIESTLRKENHDLQTELRHTQLDYEDATKSRRELQEQMKELRYQLDSVSQDNNSLKQRNPYVLALIDGDGLIFKENLIKQGLEGGKKAAYALRQEISQRCDNADDTEIITKVVANLSGLAKAMKRDDTIQNESDLRDFMLGFTQAKASFDFIDVGHGKERADSKIKETTRWNLRNFNCKQILLGVSHDAGYAPFLDEILRDDSTRKRITILEGFPTVREIIATGANVVNFDDLFRTDKLVDRTSPVLYSPASVASTPLQSISYATPSSDDYSAPGPQICEYARWSPDFGHCQVRAGPAPWNPGSRGIDPPLIIDQAVLDRIKKRKDNDKLCNNHYLRGPCAKGDQCCFEHDYKPNGEELKAISHLARLNPCTNGQDCEVENCIYGHHCPSVVNGICLHPFCKFHANEHPPGTKLKTMKKAFAAYE